MVVTEPRENRRSAVVVEDAALREFARSLRGYLVLPGDPTYDDERKIFNARIDRRPAIIAKVADAEDVVKALAFARAHDLPIAVRGGGHSGAGHSTVDGGLLIDLSLRKQVHVDFERHVARAGTGLRAGEYIAQVERHGFVSPIGDASHTGLGGLTIGGGYGWLSGKLGMVIDNLIGAEIVTADGRILHISEREHPDLFWAIRGGSGNFGVVTTYEFRLVPMTQVLGGMLVFPFPLAKQVLETYREVTENAPDELTTYAALATMPDGMPVAGVIFCYSGDDLAEGERLIAPFRALGPVADMTQPMPYSGMTAFTDPLAPEGMQRDEKWVNVRAVTDEAIDQLIELAAPERSLGNVVVIKQLNGAAARVAPTATAFPHRQVPYSILALGFWTNPAEEQANFAWVRDVVAVTEPQAAGVYVNGADGDSARAIYGVNLERLIQVKNRYDPTNLFAMNHNIEPTL